MTPLAPTGTAARLLVIGLGHVGCVTAACLASLGHSVTGVDCDPYKVRCIESGQAPFYEPGLGELVQQVVGQRKLRVSTEMLPAALDAEIALIAVGTPSDPGGNYQLDQLRRVVCELAEVLPLRTSPLIVGVRSTVTPGTCEAEVLKVLASRGAVSVVSFPEFLREGTAIQDFLRPPMLVVGSPDRCAAERVASLYHPLPLRPALVTLRTAELMKPACNAFHALKIAFANEMDAMAEAHGVNGAELMQLLCEDSRLNLSAAYLTPGSAFGGSCLPKDLRALTRCGERATLRLPLLGSVLESNQDHINRIVERLAGLPVQHIGVAGLAFKEGTDDVRESIQVLLIERLLQLGRSVRVWDAHAIPSRLYGSNRAFLLEVLPEIDAIFEPDLDRLVDWSECVVTRPKLAPESLDRIGSKAVPFRS